MELDGIQQIEAATRVIREEIRRLGVALMFVVAIILYVKSRGEVSPMLIVAGMVGGCMALNIGAVSGLGLRRENLNQSFARTLEPIYLHHLGGDEANVRRVQQGFRTAEL